MQNFADEWSTVNDEEKIQKQSTTKNGIGQTKLGSFSSLLFSIHMINSKTGQENW